MAHAVSLARSSRLFGRIEVGVDAHQFPDGPRVFGPSLVLELPIFDQRQAVIARLEAQERQAERRLTAVSVTVRSEVRLGQAEVRAARQMVDQYRDVVLPLRGRIVGQAQLHYNGMLIGLPQLLAAEAERGRGSGPLHRRRTRLLGGARRSRARGRRSHPHEREAAMKKTDDERHQPARSSRRSGRGGHDRRRAARHARTRRRRRRARAMRSRRRSRAATTRPSMVPNGATLPFKVVDGVKVFHLDRRGGRARVRARAEGEVLGLQRARPRPDDRGGRGRSRAHLRHQPPARADHRALARRAACRTAWTASAGSRRRRSRPGETFKYEFTLRQPGTFMYHPHHDEMTQMALGMIGMFVVHPRGAARHGVDRDFALMLHEWRIDPGAAPARSERDDRLQRAHDQRAGVPRHRRRSWCGRGERVRIRLGNLRAMDHHPIHLHGYHFKVTETDGGADPRRPRSGRRRPCSCRSAARARSSSSPTPRATGRCTAT